MNRVHEQCSKIDSGTVLSQNWVKNRLSAPSAQPTAQPACPGVHRPRAQRPEPLVPSVPRAPPARPYAVSRPGWPCCNTVQQPTAPCCHNTIYCIAIQSQPDQPPSHNTISVLRHKQPSSLLLCNTISPLQYNLPATIHSCNTICCIAIQLPAKPSCLLQYNFVSCNTTFSPCCNPIQHLLQYTFTSLAASKSQYNTLYCNTIWAVAQPTFALHFFFRFSLFIISISFFFQLFPAIGKCPKNYIHPFFFL